MSNNELTLTVVESSSRVPVCATLGRAGLRAGTCAMRRGARVTPPVTDTSVAPQDNFPLWPWKKRQSRSEPPHSSGSLAINGHQHTTINDNHLSTNPLLRHVRLRRIVIARQSSADVRNTRVRTCGRRLAVTRRVLPHTCWFCTRANTQRANYRPTSEADRKRGLGPSLFSDCDGADVEPIACSRRHDGRIDAALWVGIANIEQLARDLIIVRSPLRRAVVSEGRGETPRISQPRHSWERILEASRRDHLVGSFCNRYDSNMYYLSISRKGGGLD